MDRNFFRRVEIAFPILDSELKKRITGELDVYLGDNSHAWELQSDGRYIRLQEQREIDVLSAQGYLLATLTNKD
jgi:polyphosphate kinase